MNFAKGVTSGGDKVNRNETEEERRARVRRRCLDKTKMLNNIISGLILNWTYIMRWNDLFRLSSIDKLKRIFRIYVKDAERKKTNEGNNWVGPSKIGKGFTAYTRCFRWRVLALKVKFGLGANVLAIKKRNLNDISTFIDQETEVGNPIFNQQAESDQTLNWRLTNEAFTSSIHHRKQRKKIRWTWRENACGKRYNNIF